RLLQDCFRAGVQELRRAGESEFRRAAGRMQSNSAASGSEWRHRHDHASESRSRGGVLPEVGLMFVRLVYQSFFRQRRRKLLAGAAIMLGVGVATAMIAVATDVGDKMNRELRSYGANIIVYPQDDTLDEIGRAHV